MKVLDRLLLIVLVLLTAIIAAFVITGELVLPENLKPSGWLTGLDPVAAVIIVFVSALAVLAIDVRLIAVALFSNKRNADKSNMINKTQIESSELGASFITIDALNTIAHKRCMAFRFVNDCTTNVTVVNNGIIVAVRVVPMPDINLPESMRELQASLKNTLEEQAGIRVVEIPVLILPQATVKQRANAF